jgi:hypothetical protein
VAIDVEAIKTIQSFEGNSLSDNPWNYTQICRAAQLSIGVKSEAEYTVVKDT